MRTPQFVAPIAALLLSVKGLSADPAPAAPAASRVREVIVVFKTHFDIGYREAACRGRRGGGSASPTNKTTESLSNSCSGSQYSLGRSHLSSASAVRGTPPLRISPPSPVTRTSSSRRKPRDSSGM